MPLDPPAGFNEPQASESTPTESVDIDADNVVLVQSQDQGIQVNLPKEGVDVGCQFHAKGEQLMMKSAYTQTEFTLYIPHLCTTSTQVEEDDFPIRSSVGTVVSALAFHQCGPGSSPGSDVICGLRLMILYSAPRGFSPSTPVFPFHQKPTFGLI